MAELSDFTHGPGWTIRWTNDPDPNPTYPKDNTLLIVPNASDSNEVDLIWMDEDKNRHDLQGIPFVPSIDGGRLFGTTDDYVVTVTMTGLKQITGCVKSKSIQPEAGTWGADANGGWEEKA